MMEAASRVLRETFGHAEFRGGQEAVVRILLEGRSALAIFPTGGGKSLCYQLPAVLFDGLTLVVSPLIALMKEQVERLRMMGIPAARWDSTLSAAEVAEVRENLQHGRLKLLYLSPERLSNEPLQELLRSLDIALVAIDEAHCISEWGHNFRPDYLKLAKVCRKIKAPRVLALTATATPKVATDIRKKFRIEKDDAVVLDFHRRNLDLRITPCDADERKTILLERLGSVDGVAVVYVTRQETAEEVATFLNRNGIGTRAYHAGLPQEFRDDAQQAFMSGTTRVVVATIAFGMGVDKADVRAVLHYNLPKSLENYVQETGRAGRDDKPAHCEMLACAEDLTVLENFIHADVPSEMAMHHLLDRVLRLGNPFDVSIYDLSVACDIRSSVVETIFAYLEDDGWIKPMGSFYDKYRAKTLRPVDAMMAGYMAAERRFLTDVWEHGEEKRYWRWFVPTEIAVVLGVKREKIVAALQEFAAAGDIVLQASAVRRIYRMKKTEIDLPAITAAMTSRFAVREKNDLERLAMVAGLSGKRGCLTDALTSHFGQPLAEPCGHCDRCRGVKAKAIRRVTLRGITDEEWQSIQSVIRENHPALSTPRQLARFLCGMTSPAATRAKRSRHDAFALLGDLPFRDVLANVVALI